MTLPKPNGPFHVSIADVEVKSPNPVLFRLFYPTDQDPKSHQTNSSCSSASSRITSWLPDPLFYCKGYVDFLNVSKWIAVPIFWIMLNRIKCPTSNCSPLLNTLSSMNQGTNQKGTHEPNFNKENLKFPVAIYCHGLSGMRTTYSTFCQDLASHGIIVASMEHRDGSACVASVNGHASKVRYLRPEHVQPKPDQPIEEFLLEFRKSQVDIKVQEVETCYQVLKSINQGELIHNVMLENDGVKHLAADEELLKQFEGRLDLEHSILIGHSFGGATTLTAIQKESHPFKCALVYDPWMHAVDTSLPINIPVFSLQSETFHWKSNLDPIFKQFQHILSDSKLKAFDQSSSNATTNSSYTNVNSKKNIDSSKQDNGITTYEDADDNNEDDTTHKLLHPDSIFLVLKGTAHQNLSDFPFLYPSVMKTIKQAGSADPHRSWSKGWSPATIDFIMKFLHDEHHDWIKQGFFQRGFLDALHHHDHHRTHDENNNNNSSSSALKGTSMTTKPFSNIDQECFKEFLVGKEAFDFLYQDIKTTFD